MPADVMTNKMLSECPATVESWAPKDLPSAALLGEIQQVVDTCSAIMGTPERRFREALTLARGIQRLREIISFELVTSNLMGLQNTALGFLTDRKAPDYPNGYDIATVRECLIEAMILGVRPTNNEFNIIAGRVYVTKNGLARLVREHPNLTDLQLMPGIPALAADGQGALVPFVATWRLNGREFQMSRIKVDV